MLGSLKNYLHERSEKARIKRNEEVLAKLRTDEEFCKLCVAHAIKAEKLAIGALSSEELNKIDRVWRRYNSLKREIKSYEDEVEEYKQKAKDAPKQKYADEYLLRAWACNEYVEKLKDTLHFNYMWCVDELEEQLMAEKKTPLEILDERMRQKPVQAVPNLEAMHLKAQASVERRKKRIAAGETLKRQMQAKGQEIAEIGKQKAEKETIALAKHAKFLISARIEEIEKARTPTYFVHRNLRDKKIAGLKAIIRAINGGMLKEDFTLQDIIKFKRKEFKELDTDGYFKKSSTKSLLDDLIEFEKELHNDQERYVKEEVFPYFGIKEATRGA